MATNLEKLDDPRIARFLRDRLGEASWKVEEAKAKLSHIMQKANDGEAQLIGKRNPVLVIGLDELEELMIGFREPETWGEYFYPPVDDAGLGADLVMPRGRRSAPIVLDAANEARRPTRDDAEQQPAASSPDYADLESELQLTRDYAEFGDSDAAAGILQEALASLRRVRSLPAGFAAGLREAARWSAAASPARDLPAELDGFLAVHPIGSKVEGRVARIDGCWITIALGAMLGVAYARPATAEQLTAGNGVEAYVVGANLKKNTVALSLGRTVPGDLADGSHERRRADEQAATGRRRERDGR